jgi:hypothetical protein
MELVVCCRRIADNAGGANAHPASSARSRCSRAAGQLEAIETANARCRRAPVMRPDVPAPQGLFGRSHHRGGDCPARVTLSWHLVSTRDLVAPTGACRGRRWRVFLPGSGQFPWCFQSHASVAVTGKKYVSERTAHGRASPAITPLVSGPRPLSFRQIRRSPEGVGTVPVGTCCSLN